MINYTPRLDKALRKAAWAHEQAGQHRKGTDIPYIIHPFGVMTIASSATGDEDILIACLFHDILEDVDSSIYSEDDMRQEFGDRIAEIVLGVTKNSALKSWRATSEAYLEHLEKVASEESVIVSAADKIHNLKSVLYDHGVVGDELWQRFSTRSATDQLWWYESILAVVTSRKAPKPLIEEFSADMKKLKEIVQ